MTAEAEARIMSERREHPPTPGNPALEPLLEVTMQRAMAPGSWDDFVASITPRGAVFGNDS